MDYLLFTYPNCAKCEALKKKLAETGTPYAEYGLTQTPGKAKIREFISVIIAELRQHITSWHPYQVPEILATAITHSHPNYAAWVLAEVPSRDAG